MKWNEIFGLVLVILFLSTLFTAIPKDIDPTVETLSSAYCWVKYELNGMRTSWDDNLIIKFWSIPSGLEYYCDVTVNDTTYRKIPYIIYADSTFGMWNWEFKPGTTPVKSLFLHGKLLGENDLFLYPLTNEININEPIYLKRDIPYQY